MSNLYQLYAFVTAQYWALHLNEQLKQIMNHFAPPEQ